MSRRTLTAAALALAILGAALLVDLHAEAAFDAPKRLVALGGIALAAFFAFGWGDRALSLPRPASARLALMLFAIAVGTGLLAALLSPRRALSLDAFRTLLLFALALPLGASRMIDDRGDHLLLATFLGGCVANAILSLLQGAGVVQPFVIVASTGREATGAFLGNEGQLGQALALGGAAAFVLAIRAPGPAIRVAAATAGCLFGVTLAMNQNVTALAALAAGCAVSSHPRSGRRFAVSAAIITFAIAAVVAATPPLRQRSVAAFESLATGRWDALLSNRLAPWSAAVEMVRARPLLGFGPGTFAAEFLPHRLEAEIRLRQRLASFALHTSYAEAHSEYLQLLAEGGLLTTVSLLGSLAVLFAGLVRLRRRQPERLETALLLSLLVTAAVEALTWFPLQVPLSALPVLLAIGRGWRLLADHPA